MGIAIAMLAVVPFWEESMDVTRFYASGWGDAVYWGRHLVYSSNDEPHGGTWNRWDARGATWGALGGFRRNEWGVEVLYEETKLKNWSRQNDVVYDPSAKTDIYLLISRYMNPTSHTYLGFGIRYLKMTSGKVATYSDYYNVNSEITGNSFGVDGKLFLENSRFNQPNRGLLPWVGGYFGFYKCSYTDDNKVASDALTPDMSLNLGIMVKPWSWLDFWGMAGVNVLEATYEIGTTAETDYDYVRSSNTMASFRVGMTLTYTKGYILE